MQQRGTSSNTTTQEVDPAEASQPPKKKEGTPDSDVVFKTAPNTPILPRLPITTTNIFELPSITENGNHTTKPSDIDNNTNNIKKSTESLAKGDCDNNTTDISNDNSTKQTEQISEIPTACVQLINDNVLNASDDNPQVKSKQKAEVSSPELHTVDIKHGAVKSDRLIETDKTNKIKMAESAECCVHSNADTNAHKDVIPFADSDVDEDISQETSKSETTCSNSMNHEKSSTYSEKSNGKIQILNSLENDNVDKSSGESDRKSDSNASNENKIDQGSIRQDDVSQPSDDEKHISVERENNEKISESKETEDEASDSEMRDEIKINDKEDNNSEEESQDATDVEIEEEEEEEEEEEIVQEETVEEEIEIDENDDITRKEVKKAIEIVEKTNAGEKCNITINKDDIQVIKSNAAIETNKNQEKGEENNSDDEESREETEDDEENQEVTESGSRTEERTTDDFSGQRQELDFENKENLVNIESKADCQIRELKTELKQSEKEINNLTIQVGDLQREVMTKGSGMERLQAELTAAYTESEFVRKKLKKLEEDLDTFKQKNSDLTDELNRKTEAENENDYWKVIELENEVKEQAQRIKDLENQIRAIRLERDNLAKALEEMTQEREEERKIVQEALDEALAEKIAIQEKFEREFEKLRSVNCDREQKMFDDFEWKLREVESACKKRLEEKEQSSKQLIREIEGKLIIAEGKLAQLPHLKQCEQELNQLREKSLEQTRSLRTATRQVEQFQNNEKLLQDEIKQLKTLLEKEKSHLATVQSIHNREIQEKDRKLQFKLDQQKNEITSEWEERLRRDTQKIKTELERIFRNEKQLALEEVKQQHDHKMRQLKSTWEKKHEDNAKEIEQLKQKLSEKEEEFKRELETAQTASDRDIFELRRKLDKIDMSYQEKIEKLQEKHEKEIERITEEADRKLQQCELNWQTQVGSTRTTIELVKEQMQREAQEQLQELSERHRRQLEEQWDQLIQERDETIALMEQKHRTSMEKLRVELDAIYKSRNSRESELMDTLNHLRQELSGKTNAIDDLKSNVDELHENLEVLTTEVSDKSNELSKAKQTTDEKIRNVRVVANSENETAGTAAGGITSGTNHGNERAPSKRSNSLAKQRRRPTEENCRIN